MMSWNAIAIEFDDHLYLSYDIMPLQDGYIVLNEPIAFRVDHGMRATCSNGVWFQMWGSDYCYWARDNLHRTLYECSYAAHVFGEIVDDG